MGIHQKIINYDALFLSYSNSLPTVVDYNELEKIMQAGKKRKDDRLVVNELSEVSTEDREYIKRNAYTRYAGADELENIPSCECSAIIGRFNLGVVCEICGSEVQNRYESDLHAMVWIKAPKGIPALINPIAWNILTNRFNSVARFDVIRWLCDTSYVGPSGKPPIITQLESEKIPRGLSNFYYHFDAIMERLFEIRAFRRGPAREIDEVREFVRINRDAIFCQYLPIPNRVLFVIEGTNFGSYVNLGVTGAVNALWLMTGIDSDLSNLKLWQKENRTTKAIALLNEFNLETIYSTFTEKEGVFRGQIFGTRTIFGFRTVISSITDAHDYREIHIPWGVATTLLRYHVINRLKARGHNPKFIRNLISEYAVRYHPLLDEIFKELISEAAKDNGVGIPVLGVRYPTLQRGSVPYFYISKIKEQPDDVTTSISILSVKSLNADFDGDSMTFILLNDKKLIDGLSMLGIHYSALSLSAPNSVSTDLAMPKPVVATIANYLHTKEAPDPVKREKMKSLAM